LAALGTRWPKREGAGERNHEIQEMHERMARWDRRVFVLARGKRLNLTIPTVPASLRHLQKLGIARETTGCKQRGLHRYDRYLKLLNTESVGKYRL